MKLIREVRSDLFSGTIGLSPAPRSDAEFEIWRQWQPTYVLTLIPDDELEMLGIPDIEERVNSFPAKWKHLAISDFQIPTSQFEIIWDAVSSELKSCLENGGKILVHCRMGQGRSGTVAGRLLKLFGLSGDDAIRQVRLAQAAAIETEGQEAHLRD